MRVLSGQPENVRNACGPTATPGALNSVCLHRHALGMNVTLVMQVSHCRPIWNCTRHAVGQLETSDAEKGQPFQPSHAIHTHICPQHKGLHMIDQIDTS